MRVDFIYFDIDDTLLDHRKAQERALNDVHHHFTEHFDDIPLTQVQSVYHQINSELWRQYSSGKVSREHLQEQRFIQLFNHLSIHTLPYHQASKHYMERYTKHWEYCLGARETFMEVADQFPVGVLTNGFAEVQHAKLAHFKEVRDRLSVTIISEEVGYMKPHPALFRHAALQAETAPSSILYIGDSYFSDIQGGLNAGWQVIWYAPEAIDSDVPENVPHVRSLPEILDLL